MVAALFMGAAIKPRPVFVKPGWAELTLLLRVSAGTTWHRLYPARGNIYLTPHAPNIVNEAVSGLSETGAPEEIEVTPEMIRAGARIYYAWDQRIGMFEYIVDDIFEAMWSARRDKMASPEVGGTLSGHLVGSEEAE